MTVFYPDISSYEEGLRIQPGTVAVVAKATEGTYYVDKSYDDFKAQAENVGAIFSGYHFLVTGSDAASQARAYFNKAGATPCMLDVETTGTSKPSVDLVVDFIEALQGLGGRVWGVYFPRWYWAQVGGDLSRLTAAGAALVSSNYTGYSDTGAGWSPYGGATPAVWQYTNAQPYGGQTMDFNAFKGTADQLSELINGDTMTPDDIRAIAKAVYEYSEESVNINGKPYQASLGQLAHGAHVSTNDPNGSVLKALAVLQASVSALGTKVDNIVAGNGASPQAVAAETLAELKAKL